MYALFRNSATVRKTEVASVIDMTNRIPFRDSRKYGISKAKKRGLEVVEGNFGPDLEAFWNVLAGLLDEKFGSKPVHTIDEMRLLQSRFPDNIKLYLVKEADTVLAGTIIYDTGTVARTQYIAASADGKNCGALDFLFWHLLGETFASRHFFDFGGSTLYGGNHLNEGLIFQKEGFGGRAVVMNTYELLF